MENQHRKISGYRELSQEEIDLMNRIKEFGPQLEQLVLDIASVPIPFDPSGDTQRWIETGKTNLQLGLMCLTRAVAKPTLF